MFNCLCRQAGFSVLPGCDVWFFSAHMKRLCCSVFVFFSVFGGLALATLFLSTAVPGAVSEQRHWGCGSVFASKERFGIGSQWGFIFSILKGF